MPPPARVLGRMWPETGEGGGGLERVGEERRVEPSRGGVVAVRLEVDLRGPQWRGKRPPGFHSRTRARVYGQYGVGNVVLSVREYGSAGYVSTDKYGVRNMVLSVREYG